MSEGLSNIVYLLISVIAFVMAGWKALALFRDATPTLALIVSMQLCGSVVYAIASPVGYRTLGEATGRPSFATLPVYVGILTCFALVHILTLLWDPRLRAVRSALRRTVTAWCAAYASGATLMILFFSFADLCGPADPLRFNTAFARDPMVLLFLVIFLATLTSGTLNTWRQCRHMRLSDPRLQRCVRAFATAMLWVFGYVLCSAPAAALAALGNHSLDTVGVLGSTCGVIGTITLYYGLASAAVGAWWTERRDFKALEPLWELVVARVDQDLAFSAKAAHNRGPAAVNVTFRLHRRVIEILDGMRALRPWVSSAPLEAVRLLHDRHVERGGPWKSLSEQDVEAAATAAALRDAVGRLHAAKRSRPHTDRPQPPDGPAVLLPGENTPAADERGRLLLLSDALSHPLVSEALREVAGADRAGSQRVRAADRAWQERDTGGRDAAASAPGPHGTRSASHQPSE
ncbi:MAB_1171c family putative transporter [Streptomyces sp. NPDC017405]|uniref:MAB_1171c family putative transporter n=1 Tax=unclassified Streptomyces TaxID=2593676 RepID=UPI0037A459FD